MGSTILSFLGLFLQIAGFVFFCCLGARLSDRLEKKSRWLPLALGSAVLAVIIVAMFFVTPPLTFIPQTALFFCLAFGGGLVARQQNRIVGQ